MLTFLKVFFNSLLKKIKFKQIGRNFFNPGQATKIGHHNIEVWPGFSSSLQLLEQGVMLNVDIVHKVLRLDTVLDVMGELKSRCRGDLVADIKKAMLGSTVMTSYNKRTYKIDDIDFTITPKDTFKVGDSEENEAEETSYVDYFRTKYSCNITDLNQPMLISVN